LVGHDDKLRDVLREKLARSAFENILTFLRMLEWQLMKCAGSLGFLWEDETRGHVGRMIGGAILRNSEAATIINLQADPSRFSPSRRAFNFSLSSFILHPSSFILHPSDRASLLLLHPGP
jgi:hypothetical protein